MSGLEQAAHAISGVLEPAALGEALHGKNTASQLVQLAAYRLSSAVFTFSPPTFDLDRDVAYWASTAAKNDNGEIPLYVAMEARAGAGAGLAAYTRDARGLVSVLASSGALRSMEPALLQFSDDLKSTVFHVAAVEYTDKLESDVLDAAAIARRLGFEVFVSAFTNAFEVSVAASRRALETKRPVVHVYDGLRGTRQAFASAPPSPAQVGTLAPFTFVGGSGASSVYVSAASSVPHPGAHLAFTSLDAAASGSFVKALPASVRELVVLEFGLYKLVRAAARGLSVRYEPLDIFVQNVAPSAATLVWDSDTAVSARAGGSLTKLVPTATNYVVFDNTVAGGSVVQEVRLNFGGEFYDSRADVVIVNSPAVLKTVDVSHRLAANGKLAVAGDATEVAGLLAPLLPRLAAKGAQVFAINYAAIDTQNTQGWTPLMAAQGAIWLLNGLDVDSATSRVVHSLGRDMELVAITVNQIVRALADGALQAVEYDRKLEDTSELVLRTDAVPTSFVPFGAQRPDEEAVPGANVDEVSALALKQRLVFKHAFGEQKRLRPEVPTKTYVAKVKQNMRVTPSDYDRHIFELELDIAGTGMRYAIGESLGVHSPNNADDVLAFLDFYKADPEQVLGVPLEGEKAYRTVFQLFANHVDLFGKVPKRFYESLAAYASDPSEKEHLLKLATPAGAEELKERAELDFENYVDVLREFKSARPTLRELVDLVAPLKRREYSIASSQHAHPDEVHLLIVVVDWKTRKGEIRHGQCSKYLSGLRQGDTVIVSVKPSVTKLPTNPETPIIMAGLGTGLAPFKAFLEEKQWQREQGLPIGPVYLFLGSRHRRQEYLYGELFEAYKAAGVLTHIGAAFSRDQAQKVYIQHRIQQAKEELVDAFVHKQGNFYLCGPTWPVPDISQALTDIVVAGAPPGETVDTANLIEDLKEAERYILEVY